MSIRRPIATGSAASLALVVAAGVLTAGGTLAKAPPDKLLCSRAANGGKAVKGVCVLPEATVGQRYEGFIQTKDNAGGTFSIAAGKVPPGLSMPHRYGAAGTIVAGTPARRGTFTFTVRGIDQAGQRMRETYSISVDAPARLEISFPKTCCVGGTKARSYLQNIAISGGVGPYRASIASGRLPPGLTLAPSPPISIAGRPTAAGTFAFKVTVSDGRDAHASKQGSITIH